MKHYLIDTNVIIDMLLDREDADAACAVIDAAERGEIMLHFCALSYTNIYYSLRKYLTREERISCLTQLSGLLVTIPVDGLIIHDALMSGWKDFEDAVQSATAERLRADCIITRNVRDFSGSRIAAFTPSEYLARYYS